MHQSLNTNNSGALILLTVLAFASFSLVYGRKQSNPGILAQFALLGNSHLNHATFGEEANYTAHFEKAIKQVNAAGVDFVLIAGDLTQSGKPDEFSLFKTEISKIFVPVWVVPGNHDIGNKFSPHDKGEHMTLTRMKTYEKHIGPSWFSADCAGVHIICINSSLPGSGYEPEQKMWKFIEKELTTSTKVPTILLMHYPLFLNDPVEPGDYWNIEPAPRKRLLDLLKKSNVKMVLSAHLHKQLVNNRDGILFVTTAATSFGIPAGKQPEGWTLITILKNGKTTFSFHDLNQ
jgi:3',5'-cyclic AMP phosphodiesterase CpdA